MSADDWVPTTQLRFVDRRDSYTGQYHSLLQQFWQYKAGDALLLPGEWRDVEHAGREQDALP